MITFSNNNSTKFCQITLCVTRYIHKKRKVVPFFCLIVYTCIKHVMNDVKNINEIAHWQRILIICLRQILSWKSA